MKKTRKVKYGRFIISILFLSIIFSACQEPKIGCLDVRATNFDVAAASACTDGCCTYPNLTLELNYWAGDTTLSTSKSYFIGNDSIKFITTQMYLSDFQLVTNSNSAATVTDSTPIYRQSDTINVLKNFALVGRNIGFTFQLGQFSAPKSYSKVTFLVGLNDKVKTTVPTKMSSTSPLSTQSDSMYTTATKSYIFNKIVISRKKANDTLSFSITTPKAIEIVKNLSFAEGIDAAIPLKINYLKFFENVDFTKPKNEIMQKIVDNTPFVFN